MHQSAGHLLFVLDTDDRLQHRAEQHVVVGGVLCKLFVELHGQDVHALVPGLDADHGSSRFPFPWIGLANWVPFLDQLPARNIHRWNAHQPHIVVLVLFLLLVRVPIEMDGDVLDRREVIELKVFTPEDVIRLQLAGGAGIETVIQAELTEVLFLGRKVLSFDDPQLERILHPPTVVLETEGHCEVSGLLGCHVTAVTGYYRISVASNRVSDLEMT